MAFVKLDCGMLDSTIWVDRIAREMFVTALLMAEPRELKTDQRQIEVRTLEETKYVVPAGWYGFVPAAGTGIIRRAGIELEEGMKALERLCSPDTESRSPDHEGRRMARVDGGYVILNFIKYRERDHTTAERSKRYREKKRSLRHAIDTESHGVTTRRHTVTPASVTQAEAEAEVLAEAENIRSSDLPASPGGVRVADVSPRKRNEVLDALASVGGSDPLQIPKTAWSGIGKCLADIKTVCPDVSVVEIQRRAENYGLHFKVGITPHALVKHWARCDNPPTGAQGTLPVVDEASRERRRAF